MLTGNNYTVMDDGIDILRKLMEDLYTQTGIHYFRQFNVKENNIQFCCPIHKGGQERKPSCGMSTVNRHKQDGTFIPAGTVHCFTCGYTATLPEMISRLFGKNDGGIFGLRWIVKNFTATALETRKDLELDLSRHKTIQKYDYVSEEELDRYRFYHNYMFKRGLTEELIEKYDVGYDPAFRLKSDKPAFPCITFPVRNANGNTLFIARRAIKFKLYHYPQNVEKPLYGLYELDDYKELIVCESILNAVTAVKYGRNAIALLGTGTENQYKQISKLPCRVIITAFDGDEAGRKAAQRFKANIHNKLIRSFVIPEGKDINDLSQEEFNNLREIF